jgi:hypothetical protein
MNHIQQLALIKEEILHDIVKKLGKDTPFTTFNLLLEKYLKIVIELSKPTAVKIILRVDQGILDSLELDLLSILVFSVELKRALN